MEKKWWQYPSAWAAMLIVIVYVWVPFNLKQWKTKNVIINDVIMYYEYLPATFIYKDLSFEFQKSLPPDFDGQIWVARDSSSNGGAYLKMTMGLSFLYAPFFLATYVYDLAFDNPDPTGYAPIYHKSIALAAVFYALLSLFIFRRLFLRFFEDKVVALLMLSVFLATNLLHYAVAAPGMPHAYNFFLFVLFVDLSLKFIQSPNTKYALLSGLTLGLIVLIRPTNGLVLLFPLLFNVASRAAIKARLKLISDNFKLFLFAFLALALVVSPQLIFWKFNTGHWLFYSYGEEGFYFQPMNYLNGLFSFRNGFFVYAPIMFCSVIGLYFAYKQKESYFISSIAFFILNTIVVFSWWCWWYGGSFGSRPMIDSLVILAFPLGALFNAFAIKSERNYALSLVLVAVLCLNSGFNSYQSRRNVIHYDSMTAKAYFSSFGKLQIPFEAPMQLEHPNYFAALKGEEAKSKKQITLFQGDSITDGIEEFPFGRLFTQQEIAAFNTDNLVLRFTFFADNNLNKSTWLVMDLTNEKGEHLQYQYQELVNPANRVNDWNYRVIGFNVDRMKANETLRFYLWNKSKLKVRVKEITLGNY